MIRMKNGATIMLETSWALNTCEPIEEGSCVLCGSRAGLQIKNNNLKINKVEYDRQVVTEVNTSAGGVAFYSGAKVTPALIEAQSWINAIVNDTDPVVLPKQDSLSPKFSRRSTPPRRPDSRYTSDEGRNLRCVARPRQGLRKARNRAW